MNKSQALDFLAKNQPLPPDELLTEDLINFYDEVRKYFIASPDKVVIPLFLNSFGDGYGFGVYQLVEDVFRHYDTEDMVNPLIEALQSEHSGVRYWSAQICASYPDPRLIPSLRNALNDERADTREAAIMALEAIGSRESIALLKEALLKETDQEIKALIRDVIR